MLTRPRLHPPHKKILFCIHRDKRIKSFVSTHAGRNQESDSTQIISLLKVFQCNKLLRGKNMNVENTTLKINNLLLKWTWANYLTPDWQSVRAKSWNTELHHLPIFHPNANDLFKLRKQSLSNLYKTYLEPKETRSKENKVISVFFSLWQGNLESNHWHWGSWHNTLVSSYKWDLLLFSVFPIYQSSLRNHSVL